jgi:hypothetical protein
VIPSLFDVYASMVSLSSITLVRGRQVVGICRPITGGVVLCAVPAIQLTPIAIDCPMIAVEVVTACVNAERSATIVVVIYRPGSDAVQSAFYDELAMVFEAVTIY